MVLVAAYALREGVVVEHRDGRPARRPHGHRGPPAVHPNAAFPPPEAIVVRGATTESLFRFDCDDFRGRTARDDAETDDAGKEEQMYEGSIPLEDFLDTMNRLQADFERRLGSIEGKVLPTPLTHVHSQERSSSSAWTPEDGYRPLGIEAIWTASRTPSDDRPSGLSRPSGPSSLGSASSPSSPQRRFSPRAWATPAD
ncbi:hypothetical protein [Streptomyces cyaneofuscatus]|uniref:hypothetical protein n=1 Tax=Streptomyces cyaneofuscatus TaxID=66883 RepID=UPI0033BB866A